MGYESKRKTLYWSGLSILAASRALDTRVGEKEESVVHPCISSLPPPLGLLLDTQSRSLLVIVVLHRLVLFCSFTAPRSFLARVMGKRKTSRLSVKQALTVMCQRRGWGRHLCSQVRKKVLNTNHRLSQQSNCSCSLEMCSHLFAGSTLDYSARVCRPPFKTTGGDHPLGNILEARARLWSLGACTNVSMCPARMTTLANRCVSILSQFGSPFPLG